MNLPSFVDFLLQQAERETKAVILELRNVQEVCFEENIKNYETTKYNGSIYDPYWFSKTKRQYQQNIIRNYHTR